MALSIMLFHVHPYKSRAWLGYDYEGQANPSHESTKALSVEEAKVWLQEFFTANTQISNVNATKSYHLGRDMFCSLALLPKLPHVIIEKDIDQVDGLIVKMRKEKAPYVLAVNKPLMMVASQGKHKVSSSFLGEVGTELEMFKGDPNNVVVVVVTSSSSSSPP
ncbi:hypothetical protein GUJ93_ZPchr0013g34160 [Zizania palustris]|uniref:Uncharacterized protein n=1 Tax=Zizania palustris TaxID=103762 RepID=A0A8J6BWQ2_ZIZPA|nr:hypothetical protein GUJ93_ZPchr0013g34160 [Zizania palustris]